MSVARQQNQKLGYAEYVLFPDDGQRHEIIDGVHYMNAAPGTYHQTVSKRLQHHLYTRVELAGLGLVFNAPVDVQLDEHDIVQPDLLVLLSDAQARVIPTRIIGPPDLLVEILSPSTVKTDSGVKRLVYQRAGVREYWLVDPVEHRVTQLVLREGVYIECLHGDQLRLSQLPAVAIPLPEIW